MVEIREVPSPEGMKDIFPIAKSAWGMDKPESFIADMLNALQYHGGLVLGAYDQGKMVGFQYAFIGRRGGLHYLYSHMTGVLEERKYSGIGFELKMAQKRWALEHGYPLVAWTYDPLMRLNANFNVRKLGVIVRAYRPNFYGVMTDRLNAGVETDRFVAEWWVGSVRGQQDLDPNTAITVNQTEPLHGDVRRISKVQFVDNSELKVEIPRDFAEIKSFSLELASDWRSRTRVIFTTLFEKGYTVVSIASIGKRIYYILSNRFHMQGIPAKSPFSD